MTCALPLILITLSLGGVPKEFESAAELEEVVLEARRAIRDGSYDVTCVTTGPKVERFEVGVRCEFDFADDDRLRFEWSQPAPKLIAAGKPLTVVSNGGKSFTRIIVAGNRLLQWSPDEFSEPTSLAATVRSFGAHGERIFDPRVLGTSAESFGHVWRCKLNHLVPSGEQRLLVTPVTKDTIAGRPVLKVEVADDRVCTTFCVSPEENYSIVYFEVAATIDGKTMISSIACKNKHCEPANVWFPETIDYSRKLDGQLLFEERISIRDAKFNVGVDSESFTVAGLGLRNGTSVLDMSLPDVDVQQEWDGKKLVRVAGFPPEEPSTDVDSIVARRAFGRLYNAIAARKQLDVLLEQKVHAMDLICGLTGAQKDKLRSAGRGDIKRLLERLGEVDDRFQLAEDDAAKADELLAEARELELGFTRPGPSKDTLLFVKSLKSTLTAEQLASNEPLAVVFSRGGLVRALPVGSGEVLHIDLTGTAFGGDDLAHLAKLSNLNSLVLSKTQVTDAGLAPLGKLKALSKLKLFDTQVTDTGVADLQRALPGLKITVDK
jgi:hypothetical protein